MMAEVCVEGREGYLSAKGVYLSMLFGEERMGVKIGRRDTERKHC